MNSIFEKVIAGRGGHYCHVAEVSDVYELECIAEQIYNEFVNTATLQEILEFLTSLEIYCLCDNKEIEKEIFNFNFKTYIYETMYIDEEA